MKNFVLFFLLSFSIEGVFGETVSVIDGDSVTLHTGLTKIQEDDVLEWRFGAGRDRIVRARKDSDPKYDDVLGGKFRDRLKLDRQTGDLTITNITTEHAGLYEISINAIALRTFTVNVVSGVDEVKSVTVGDSVTLNSGTNIQRDDVMEWRFADQNSPIAEHNRKTGIFSTYDGPDGRFRHRLQLDYLTGSLTIWNIGTKHSGLYEAVIRKNSGYTIHQSYSVTARGERKPALSVKKGVSVTLHTDLTEINTDDLMLWMFEDSVIAEINKAQNRFPTYDDVLDGRFRDRLKLDEKTGSLTITDTTTEDSGLYKLKIISSRFTIDKRITVIVSGERKPALLKKGDSVTLHTDLTEINTDDLMLWMFEDSVIAEINKAQNRFPTYDDVLDGRFRDRLKLDEKTGSLTITDTTTEDSGLYKLKIISSRFTIDKRITVIVSGLSGVEIAGIVVGLLLAFAVAAVMIYQRHRISKLIQSLRRRIVIEGESVTITPYRTEIHKDEDIEWIFKNAVIAERKGKGKDQKITEYDDVLDNKFKGRLHLDKDSGYLTINNITITHSGRYELWSGRLGNKSLKTFRVSVFDTTKITEVSVKEGGSVPLPSGVPDVQKDEQIVWKFGLEDSPIAQITDGAKKITRFGAGWRFIFRLKLDQTGSLTITKINPLDAGCYVLYIFKSGKTSITFFRVKVDENKPKKESEKKNNPEEVALNVPDSRL